MAKANDTVAVIEKIGKCSESLIIISEQVSLITKNLAEILAELKTEPDKPAEVPVKEKTLSLTEVRKILAEKSRAGFTSEVKKLLIKHGAEKLSAIAPEEYAALVAEVEVLGNE